MTLTESTISKDIGEEVKKVKERKHSSTKLGKGKTKATETTEVSVPAASESASPVAEKKAKKNKKSDGKKNQTASKAVAASSSPAKVDNSNESHTEDEDDQTATLLAGFESSSDEEDAIKEDQGLNPQINAPIGNLTKLLGDASKKVDKAGVLYVGYVQQRPFGSFRHKR